MKRLTIADLVQERDSYWATSERHRKERDDLAARNADLAQGNKERDLVIERLRAQLAGLRVVLDAAIAQVAPPFDFTRRLPDGSGWVALKSDSDAAVALELKAGRK